MADQKISALTGISTPDDADVLPIVDSSVPQTKKITVSDLRVSMSGGVPSNTRVAGFDDFTDNPWNAWQLIKENNADISQGTNGAAYGFPGSGALALNVDNTAGSKTKILRRTTGLVLDAAEPIIIEYRVWPAAAGVYNDTEAEWFVGLSDDDQLTNGAVLYAQWTDGTSTRTHYIGVVVATVPTLLPVVLPPLGVGQTGYKIKLTLSTTALLVDEGAYAVLGNLVIAVPQVTYLPFTQLGKEGGDGNRSLVLDWCRWSALRYATAIGAPSGGEFNGVTDPLEGSTGAVDNAALVADGVTGNRLKASPVVIDVGGNVTGVGNLTATGTIQGNNVTATGTVSGNDANLTGNITVGGTVDGRDVATDGIKLDGIEFFADVTDAANVAAAGAVMGSEFSVGYPGVLRADGVGGRALMRYEVAGIPPTVNDDSGDGFNRGSMWFDTGTQTIYFCLDPSVAAAIWVPLANLTIAANIYNPVFTPSDVNITITQVDSFRYTRIGSVVHVSGLVELETDGASAPDTIEISLPIVVGSSTIGFLSGSYTCQQDQTLRGPIWGDVDGVSASAFMQFVPTVAGGPYFVTIEFSYRTTS
jgi:hypothetical protein